MISDEIARIRPSREPRIASIAPLSIERVAPNAHLLAAAMDVDPAYRYLFPDATQRAMGLRDFFSRNQRVHLPYRCTHIALGEDGSACATVTLRPPSGVHISSLTMLRHGLLPFAWRHGREAVKRLLWLKSRYDVLERDASRREPHFHVHMMAVRPELQGLGLGTQLIERVLAAGLREHPGTRAVLTTHLPQNVVFYRRVGFEVCDERVLTPPGGTPYVVWSMARG